MATRRAATISVKNLSAAVEKAAKTVAAKNKAQFASGVVIGPTISGKVALQINDIAQANKLAADLTKSVGPARGAVEPAVLISGGEIICGFIVQQAVKFQA